MPPVQKVQKMQRTEGMTARWPLPFTLRQQKRFAGLRENSWLVTQGQDGTPVKETKKKVTFGKRPQDEREGFAVLSPLCLN